MIAKDFGDAEQQHVEALRGTIRKLGGKPVASPAFTFPMTGEKSFLKLAQTLEDTGVSAYNGAGPMIRNKDVLAAAGSIVQIEARHAAVIRLHARRAARAQRVRPVAHQGAGADRGQAADRELTPGGPARGHAPAGA